MSNKINVEQIKDDAKGSIKEEQSWLLTYADMMTLLFAFFVLLYSMSSPDPVKVAQLKEGMAKEMGIMAGDLNKSQNDIEKTLAEMIKELNITNSASTQRDPRGVALEIDGKLCFPVLKATMNDELIKILDKVILEILNKHDDYRLVMIEGHTDSDPIKGKENLEKYPTNWELSSARASQVVNYLIENGVNSGKLQASGYADRWPSGIPWHDIRSGKVDDTVIAEYNNTEDKKKQNRRIKIVFTNN